MDPWDSLFTPAQQPEQPAAAPQDEDPWASIFASTDPAKPTTTTPREDADSIAEFSGKKNLTVEDALEGGYAKDFLAHLRERADKLAVDTPERNEMAKRIAGLQVDLAEFDRQKRESKKLGVSRDVLARGESAVGAFEKQVAQRAVGQGLMAAEQAFGDVASTVVSLGDRAFGEGKVSSYIHREQALRDQFLEAAERGGDVEKFLGKTGSRIFNGAIRSTVKYAATGTLAGPSAVYSLIAAEAWDDGLEEAKKNNITGGKAVAYAGAKSIVEAGISALFGKAMGKLGVKLAETQFSPGMRKVIADTAEKSLKGARGTIAKELAGVAGETIEEAVTDVVSQGVELTAGVSNKFDLGRTLEAAISGAAGRAGSGAALGVSKSLNDSIKKVHPQMVEESLKGALAADSADPARAKAALEAGNRHEFEAALGIKNTSETFRESFKVAAEANQEAAAAQPEAAAAQPEAAAAQPEAAPEAAVPPPAEPTTPAAPPAATPPAGGTSTIKAELQQMMKDIGAPTVYSPARQRQLDAMEEAIAQNLPAQAVDFSSDVIANPRAISDVERGGLLVAIAQRKKQYRDLARSMSAPGADIQLASATMSRLRAESELLVAASMMAGTKTAQALAMHKYRIDDDMDVDSVIGRARVAKGAPLTEEERTKLAEDVAAMDATNAAAEAANQKIDADVANEVIKQAAQPASDIDALYKRMNELLSKGCATE